MAFNPGKKSTARKELRDMIASPQVGSQDKRRAQQLLTTMSPILNQDNTIDDMVNDDLDTSAVEALLNEATDQLAAFDVAAAKAAVDEALKLAVDGQQRALCLDLAAQIMMEEGLAPEDILGVLQEAELLTPETNHERLLTMGQFTQEFESLQCYKQAITLIDRKLSGLTNNGKIPQNKLQGEALEEFFELTFQKSTAMVAIGELYTTDLCDEDDAEQQCQTWLQAAMTTDSNNVEALRAFGNFRIIQGNTKDAINYTRKSFELLKNLVQQGMENYIPQFLPRLELCRQLYELQCWNEVISLACGLLQEEQQVGEIWLYAMIASFRYAESLNPQLIKAKQAKDKASQKKAKAIHDEIADLLTCSAQYALRIREILKKSPDAEMEQEVTKYIASLEKMGYTLKKAGQQLIELKKEQQAQLEVDMSVLDTIESDSDDEEGDNEMAD